MRKSISVALFFTVNLCLSQSFTIQWEAMRTVSYSETKSMQLPSIQGGYHDEHFIPHFSFLEETQNFEQFDMIDVISENVPKSQLGEMPLYGIPQQPEFIARVVKSGNQLRKLIDVTGFYKQGNQIRRIVGFRITAQPAPINTVVHSTSPIAPVLSSENGRTYKIRVDTTGIFRLDYDFFVQNNIPVDFNPQRLKIYGNGGQMLPETVAHFRYRGLQENAIYAHGAEDGAFNPGDYFLFYAQGPHGISRLKNNEISSPQIHTYNLYEEHAYYFIQIESSGFGKRIQEQPQVAPGANTFTNFDQILWFEEDNLNIHNLGRQWFANHFSLETSKQISFEHTGSAQSDIRLQYRMVGNQAANIPFNITLNGLPTANGSFIGSGPANFEERQGFGVVAADFPFNVNIQVNNASNPAGMVYLDFVRLSFKQALNFGSQQLGFRWLDNIVPGANYSFQLGGSPEMVWDVSDITTAQLMTGNAGVYNFLAKPVTFPNEFIAFNIAQAMIPEFVSLTEPQALSNLSGIDYLIVSYPEFRTQAQRLANYHATYSGVTTAIVTPQQIYNEFSSGGQDISGIRDFFKYLYEQNRPLQHVLLFGDASYDFKDRIPNNTNYVPSFQSYSSNSLSGSYVADDFFGMLDDTDIGVLPNNLDINIGRMTIDNLTEARALTDKTLAYYNALPGQGTAFGDWRTNVHFVVDDYNRGPGQAFHTPVDQNSAQLLETLQPYLTLRKLYADAFPWEGSAGGFRFPQVNEALVNAIETGTLLVNYFGHGGPNGWGQARLFTQNEISRLTNFNSQFSRLPLFLTVTCDFTVWDIPEIASAGEMLMKRPQGGAAAMITTSREIGVHYGISINDKIILELFTEVNNNYRSIGEVMRIVKTQHVVGSDGLKVNVLGDPLFSLARPYRDITIETINDIPAQNFQETLRAMDFVSIEGYVNEAGVNNIDPSFNGTLQGSLFDKPESITTLNNPGDLDVLTYEEQVKRLYRGGTDVQNGRFKLEFYIPRDINFDLGNGKLLLYATNEQEDAKFSRNDISIGGINPAGLDDNEGPGIKLYMNNLNFAPKGITDRNPFLLACLTDSTGINATGAGIGHDITFYLDGRVQETKVLNEYFEGGDSSPCVNPALRNFQKGKVLYPLNNLSLGEHTVTFRAWDINNNSSTATLDFVVMESGEQNLHINRLLNWPNPFTTHTYFHFEHNCPEALEVQVQIFSVAGKLVKTIRQHVSSAPFREGYRTDKFAIPWDGLDDFGNKIGKGVYIYRTIVRGSNPDTCVGTATATEKLVILK
ncbi:MAG: type IX secretion system sortase PorU [Weeksellaceae bacterium]|nr:type IX secretion system sortase PorU [Weeksellaceae bacterium]